MSAAGQPDSIESRRLWSLWEMLRVHADAYVHLGQSIAFIQGLFGLRDADPESGLPAENLSRDDMSQVSKTLAGMDRVCEQLGLVLSLRLIRSRLSDPPRNGREMQMLIDTVYAELVVGCFFMCRTSAPDSTTIKMSLGTSRARRFLLHTGS